MCALVWTFAATARVVSDEAAHHDLFAALLLEFVVVMVVAMLGRWGARKIAQPSVLGELLSGVVLGNVGYWLGLPLCMLVMHSSEAGQLFQHALVEDASISQAAADLQSSGEVRGQLVELLSGPGAPELVLMTMALWLFSNLGVILLLFMVGLESSVDEMKQVGLPATRVAMVGLVMPFALGYGAGQWLMPDAPASHSLFLAATMCATSVGITAAVFKDLGKLQTPEGRVILGAAVLDDVVGLIILAVVVGIATSGGVEVAEIARIAGLALGFLGVLVFLGDRIVRLTASVYRVFDRPHLKLFYPLFLVFLLSWLATLVGLASIIGAFGAGLILRERSLKNGDGKSVHEVQAPIEGVLAPVFFLLMGMQVNLATFADLNTVLMGLALVGAAVLGKLMSGWVAGRGVDHLTVGIGMMPRGEVTLIFAGIGKGIGVVSDALFSAIILMVITTTFLAPIGLKWSLGRRAAA